MRYRVLAAATVLTVGVITASQAAEVSEQGAKDLRSVLTRYFFLDLSKSDFITVKPAGNRYEIGYDFSKLFERINSADFSINGLKPLITYAEPLANGLWNVSGDNSADVSAHYKIGDRPATDLKYAFSSLAFNGVFDPAIGYARSMDVTGKDFKLSSVTGQQSLDAGFSGMTYALKSTDTAKPGTVDIDVKGAIPGFYEKITAMPAQSLDMHVDNVDVVGSMKGVPTKELRDLARFIFEHIKAKKLSKKGNETFQQLARAALPLFASFDETVTYSNSSFVMDKGKADLGKLIYSVKMNGLTKQSNIGFGMSAEDIKLDSDAIPASYAALVPTKVVVEAGVPDMNFADAADIVLSTDFSDSKALSPDMGKRLGDAVFPNHKMKVEVPEISAVSSVYDIAASGKIEVDLQNSKHFALEASILARDYDKTIAFIQNAAKTDPQLNQLSFGMMMAKGFAKTDPDGRQRWDITMGDNGAVTVNGQVLSSPK